MKYVFLFLLFIPMFVAAQSTGKVTYTETLKLTPPSRPGIPKEVLDRMPKERKMSRELLFNGNESIYKKGKLIVVEDSQPNDERANRRRNRMMRGGENGESYKNLESGQMIDQRNIYGKEFLVHDELIQYKWKITGNKKQILNYLVMEAQTTIEDSIQITAWFTPQIPIQNGPSRFGGLPGLILELDQDKGTNHIVASAIQLENLDEVLSIEEPTKGKKVTQLEFREIRAQKREELREQGGGQTGRRQFRGRGNN